MTDGAAKVYEESVVASMPVAMAGKGAARRSNGRMGGKVSRETWRTIIGHFSRPERYAGRPLRQSPFRRRRPPEEPQRVRGQFFPPSGTRPSIDTQVSLLARKLD